MIVAHLQEKQVGTLPNPGARGILHFTAHKLKSRKSSLISPSRYATGNGGATEVGVQATYFYYGEKTNG